VRSSGTTVNVPSGSNSPSPLAGEGRGEGEGAMLSGVGNVTRPPVRSRQGRGRFTRRDLTGQGLIYRGLPQ